MLPMFHPMPFRRYPYATKFAEYPLGAQLEDHGWTEHGDAGGTITDGDYEIVADAGSLSGKAVYVTQGGVNRYRAITWDKLGTVTDFELLALIKLVELPNAIGGGGLCRVSTGAAKNGYDCVFDDTAVAPGADSFHASQFTGGFFDNIISGTITGIDLNTTDRFWMRFRINGTTIGVKAWKYGDSEPAFSSGPDQTYVSGALGIQTVEQRDFKVYYFAAALGAGLSAPFPWQHV